MNSINEQYEEMAEPQKKKQKRISSAAQEEEEHRLHVSGLNPASVSVDDLRSRFSSFGTVTDLTNWPPTKPSHDAVGRPITYTFLTLKTTQQQVSRCLSLLNNSAWKGSKLKIGHAHQHFSAKLQQEKKQTQESGWKPQTKAEVDARLALLPGGKPLTLQQVQSSPARAAPALRPTSSAANPPSESDSSSEDDTDGTESNSESNEASDDDDSGDDDGDDDDDEEEEGEQEHQELNGQAGVIQAATEDTFTDEQMSDEEPSEDESAGEPADQADAILPDDGESDAPSLRSEEEESKSSEGDVDQAEGAHESEAAEEGTKPPGTVKPTTHAGQIPLHFGGVSAASNDPSPYFSILGGLALDDMEMDEDFEFGREEEQYQQQHSMVDGEPVQSLWNTATKPTDDIAGSEPNVKGKLPLLFPKMDSRLGKRVLATQDDRSTLLPFHRTQSVDEIEQQWKDNRRTLTQEYKRRHREAVKKHKRRIVGSRLTGGGVAIRATAAQSRAM